MTMSNRSDATMTGARIPNTMLATLRDQGGMSGVSAHRLVKYAVARACGATVEEARSFAMSDLPRPTGKPYGPRQPKAPAS